MADAATTPGRVKSLARAARLPGFWEISAFVAATCVILTLAIFTISMRFQLVDWRVEARDLQAKVRRAEAMEIKLRNDIARWERADYLKQLAAETLALEPILSRNLAELAVSPSAVSRYEAAFAELELPAEKAESPRIAPWAAMLSEKFDPRGAREKDASSSEPAADKNETPASDDAQPAPEASPELAVSPDSTTKGAPSQS